MSINTDFVHSATAGITDESKRISALSTTIAQTAGGYTSLPHCQPAYFARALTNMRYQNLALEELTDFAHKAVTGAFERGVFVVSCAVANNATFHITDADDLLRHLQNKGDDRYLPDVWYTQSCYENCLALKHWPEDIIAEIAPWVTRRARMAFLAGLKTACGHVTSPACKH